MSHGHISKNSSNRLKKGKISGQDRSGERYLQDNDWRPGHLLSQARGGHRYFAWNA